MDDHKNKEDALQKIAKEYEMILDSVPAWIFYKDRENRFIKVNKTYADIVGLPKDRLEGKKISDLYPKKEAEKYWQDDKEVMKSGQPKLNIIESVDTKKGRLWVRTDKIPYKDEGGNIIGIIGFSVDITENIVLNTLQAEMSSIVENSEDAIIGKTLDGIVTSWNKGAERLYGYLHKEIIGHSISRVIPPDRMEEFKAIMKKISRGERIKGLETKRVRKDGSFIDISLTASPIRDAKGDIVGASTIAHDITEQKKQRDLIAESEEKYRALYNSSKDAIMIADTNKGFMSGNPSTLIMFGCRDEAEFVRQSPASLSPEYQPDGELSSVKAKKMMEIALEKGSNFFEWVHRALDGKEFYATVLLTKVNLKGESVVLATVRDITQLQKYQDELKMSFLEWERTFNSISDLIFIQGPDNTVLRVNKAFADFMKKPEKDIVGKKCYQLLHKTDKPWPDCPMEKTKIDRKPHAEEVNDPNIGIPLFVTTSPIFDEKGNFIGSVHIAKDIAALKKTEGELRKKIEDLERFKRVTVGRELRMKELKAKIAELEAASGKA